MSNLLMSEGKTRLHI